jgi:NAD(P)-dependent dehydrogenase (short-subunit alcohol dehydrogenase family)
LCLEPTSSQRTSQTYLITGASRGIGLQFVKQLLARGDRVIAGARSPSTATYLQEIKNDKLQIIQLDVTDINSIKAAAAEVDRIAPEGIDVLINK